MFPLPVELLKIFKKNSLKYESQKKVVFQTYRYRDIWQCVYNNNNNIKVFGKSVMETLLRIYMSPDGTNMATRPEEEIKHFHFQVIKEKNIANILDFLKGEKREQHLPESPRTSLNIRCILQENLSLSS